MSTYLFSNDTGLYVKGEDGIPFPVNPNDPSQSLESCPRFPVDPSDPSKGFETVETEAYQRSQAFQRWLAEGNAPAPYEEPEAERVSRERTRIALRFRDLELAQARPVAALQNGTGSIEDEIILDAIEWEKAELRDELAALALESP